MHVQLPEELEQFIQSRVDSGVYGSASDVVSDALRLLAERDGLISVRKAELRQKIAAGLESLQRGEGVDGDEFFAQLAAEEAALLPSSGR